jgi:PhzF family phenazine biosynthesis protein
LAPGLLEGLAPVEGVFRVDKLRIFIVDAFSDRRFGGNPAAVCITSTPLAEATMQRIAMEMNQPETAFVTVTDAAIEGEEPFPLRWFSPKTEIALGGHATLATSKVLLDMALIQGPGVSFTTRSGILTVFRSGHQLVLDSPADKPVSVEAPQDVLQAIGLDRAEDSFLGRSTMKLCLVAKDVRTVNELAPDFRRLIGAQALNNVKGVGVTTRGDGPYDFVSRYFNPAGGVNEDPVTGAVHTILGPYWGKVLGQPRLLAYQASARGGEIDIDISDPGRVKMVGDAVIVLEGHITVE